MIEFENLTEMLLGGSVFVLVYLVLLFLGLDENEQKQFNDFKHKIQAKFQLHNWYIIIFVILNLGVKGNYEYWYENNG